MRATTLLLLLAAVSPLVQAQSPVPLSLPDTVVYREPGMVAGTAVTIPVRIGSDVTGRAIRSADIVVEYDAEVLTLTGFTLGDLVPSACASAGGTGDGTINVRIACSSATPLEGGPGAVVTFEGTLLREGATSLTLSDTTPFNEGQVDAEIADGRLRVVTDRTPRLGAISDQRIDEDAPFELVVDLEDDDTDLDLLTVSIESSAPSLLPAGAASLELCPDETAASSCRVLRLQPGPDAFGEVNVTLRVSDGDSLSEDATQSFTLTVLPVNDAPRSESIDDVELPAGNVPLTVNLTDIFSDAEDDELVYTAGSSDATVASVAIDGATAIVSPLAIGDAQITLRASDNEGLDAESMFRVTVNGSVSEESKDASSLRLRGVAPNPVVRRGAVVLDLPTSTHGSVHVYDTVGREVYSTEFQSGPGRGVRVPISIESLTPGTYLYRVRMTAMREEAPLVGRLTVAR